MNVIPWSAYPWTCGEPFQNRRREIYLSLWYLHLLLYRFLNTISYIQQSHALEDTGSHPVQTADVRSTYLSRQRQIFPALSGLLHVQMLVYSV